MEPAEQALARSLGRGAGDALVEEVVALDEREIRLLRPRSSEELLDEDAFEHEEYLPYWAELWPSGVALARELDGRSLGGMRVLELGCGLGLPSIVAALAGARAVASDWSDAAIAFTQGNAARNGSAVETLRCSWAAPEPLLERAPWDLVLAADVLYEQRNVDELLPLLPHLVDRRGEIWVADPGRVAAERFLHGCDARFERRSRRRPEPPRVSVHRLRLRAQPPSPRPPRSA